MKELSKKKKELPVTPFIHLSIYLYLVTLFSLAFSYPAIHSWYASVRADDK